MAGVDRIRWKWTVLIAVWTEILNVRSKDLQRVTEFGVATRLLENVRNCACCLLAALLSRIGRAIWNLSGTTDGLRRSRRFRRRRGIGIEGADFRRGGQAERGAKADGHGIPQISVGGGGLENL